MKDSFLDSISHIIIDRLTSPLAGTFIFSWLFFNWEIIITLFGSESSQLKIFIIDHAYTKAWYDSLLRPTISTIVILIFYPTLSIPAYWAWQRIIPVKKRINAKWGDNSILSDEDRDNHLKFLQHEMEKINEQRNLYTSEKETYESTLKRFKAQLSSEQSEKETLSLAIKKLQNDIKKLTNKTSTPTETSKKIVNPKLNSDQILSNIIKNLIVDVAQHGATKWQTFGMKEIVEALLPDDHKTDSEINVYTKRITESGYFKLSNSGRFLGLSEDGDIYYVNTLKPLINNK